MQSYVRALIYARILNGQTFNKNYNRQAKIKTMVNKNTKDKQKEQLVGHQGLTGDDVNGGRDEFLCMTLS